MREWTTWRSETCFKGSSYCSGTGRSYIVIEVMQGPDLPICEGGEFLTLDFRDGTTKEQMLELINLMNERIGYVGYTAPVPVAARTMAFLLATGSDELFPVLGAGYARLGMWAKGRAATQREVSSRCLVPKDRHCSLPKSKRPYSANVRFARVYSTRRCGGNVVSEIESDGCYLVAR